MSSGHYERVYSGRKNGYGMNLYRNIKDKKICGVCAGLADHFGIDHNIMRIIFVAAFVLLMGPLVVWAYIIACILMAPRKAGQEKTAMEYDENEKCYRKKNVFRYRDSSGERIKRAKDRLDKVLRRVEDMEQYVTSKKYDLDKEFANLEK
ncbi:MAG: phage shock protein C [Lentisphaeria bacterium]|jgi:phage shock protein C